MRWQFPRSLIVSTGNVTVFNFCLNCRPECYAKLVQGNASAVSCSASKSSIRRFVITATTAFTFKTLLRHYAKQALTPRSLNVKLGPQRNYHKGRAV